MEVCDGIRNCYTKPVVIVIMFIVCFDCGVVLCVIDLHYGDVVLEWVLESFFCQGVGNLSSLDVIVIVHRLCQ